MDLVCQLDLLPTGHKLRLLAQPNYLSKLTFRYKFSVFGVFVRSRTKSCAGTIDRMPTTAGPLVARPFSDVVFASLADEVRRDFDIVNSVCFAVVCVVCLRQWQLFLLVPPLPSLPN